jgi:hypothetical protein
MVMVARTMTDPKDDPLSDLKTGFGYFMKAAKAAAKSVAKELPTDKVEEVVVASAAEVGRAFVSVKDTLEKDVFGVKPAPAATPAAATPAPATPAAATPAAGQEHAAHPNTEAAGTAGGDGKSDPGAGI